MLWILSVGFAFVAGMLVEQHKVKLGAAVGVARDAVLGARPRPAPASLSVGQSFAGLSMPFGIPWKLIGCVAVVALVLGLLFFYGNARYSEGAADERALWQQQYIDAQKRAADAEHALNMDRLERQQEAERLRVARETRLAQVREEIANAPDLDSQYAAYLAHRNSVRDEAAARHSGARADYLSSFPGST